MQLKGFLLIGFVLNVFCLNNLSGEFLTPKYDLRKNESLLESLKKDPSSFVELFAKADPEKINEVIGLLEVLAAEASSALEFLDSHVNDARISLDTAVSNVVEADINVETATTNKQTAQSVLDQADIDRTSALNDQTNAVNEEQIARSAKDVADQNYAEQSPSLLDEQQVIQNVIQILEGLKNDSDMDSEGCLITNNRYFWVVHEDSTRNWIQYPTTGCHTKALVDDETKYTKRHNGVDRYSLDRSQSAAACENLACEGFVLITDESKGVATGCPHLGGGTVTGIEGCKKLCRDTANCNAFNYKDDKCYTKNCADCDTQPYANDGFNIWMDKKLNCDPDGG